MAWHLLACLVPACSESSAVYNIQFVKKNSFFHIPPAEQHRIMSSSQEHDVLVFWFKDKAGSDLTHRYAFCAPGAVYLPKNVSCDDHITYLQDCVTSQKPLRADYIYKNKQGEVKIGRKFPCLVLAVSGKCIFFYF